MLHIITGIRTINVRIKSFKTWGGGSQLVPRAARKLVVDWYQLDGTRQRVNVIPKHWVATFRDQYLLDGIKRAACSTITSL